MTDQNPIQMFLDSFVKDLMTFLTDFIRQIVAAFLF